MNYINFIGIYLTHNGYCYPIGSYFWDQTVNSDNDDKRLSCVLPGTSLTTGQWVRVADPLDPVDCNNNNDSDPFRCSSSSNDPATVNLWLAQGLPEAQEGFYKCCLPTDCSSANEIVYANVFSKIMSMIVMCFIILVVGFVQISSFTVDFPVNMTIYPQEYNLNCVKIGYYYVYSFTMNIGNTTLANYTRCQTRSLCPNSVLLHSSNNTIRHTISLSWDGMTVSSESHNHPTTGDQHYQCVLGVINQPTRTHNVTIQGKQ